MGKKVWALASATALATMLFATAAVAANPWETADILGPGPSRSLVAEDGAKIHRTATGVTASVTMPTPEPGSYVVPTTSTSSGVEGSPAAFSFWMFVFFNPEACDGACDGPDLVGNLAVVAGAFNVGGHLVSGPNLTLSGRANQQSATFGGPNAETIAEALSLGHEIAGAEIHLAIAPHGQLDPMLLPAQITTPAGNPSFWWIALYK